MTMSQSLHPVVKIDNVQTKRLSAQSALPISTTGLHYFSLSCIVPELIDFAAVSSRAKSQKRDHWIKAVRVFVQYRLFILQKQPYISKV